MSKFKGPNHWGESGTVAGKVHYAQFGVDMARGEPREYLDANSETQQNTRFAKFSPAVRFVKQIAYQCKEFFQTKPAKRSAYSQILKALMASFGGTVAVPTFVPSGKIIGNGSIPVSAFTSLTKATTSTITAVFSEEIFSPHQLATDLMGVLAYDMSGAQAFFIQTAIARNGSPGVITVPEALVGQEIMLSGPIWNSVDGTKKSPIWLRDPNVVSIDLA